jgi:hypothetical protein
MKLIGLLILHVVFLYFLRLLWKDKNEAIQRGSVTTRIGHVSKRKSPRLFYFSVWVDFVILLVLYAVLIVFSVSSLVT